MPYAATLLVAMLLALPVQVQRRPAAPAAAAPFRTTLTVAQMTGKQAVLDTPMGTVVVDLRPDLAPNHVGYMMKLAGDGAYNGTIFHRVVRLGIVQGGDPLSKDPAKQALYGTGGLGVLQAEHSAEPFTRGAVAAALRPNQPDSAARSSSACRISRRWRAVHDLQARQRGWTSCNGSGAAGRREGRAERPRHDEER
jgi:hypothetical protein